MTHATEAKQWVCPETGRPPVFGKELFGCFIKFTVYKGLFMISARKGSF